MVTRFNSEVLFLDMIGGIAGDMFVAAMCDLDPALEDACLETIAAIDGMPDDISVAFEEHSQIGHFGRRFSVTRSDKSSHEDSNAHLSFRNAIDIINSSSLIEPVRARARDIFERLARSEGKVHGVAFQDVVFHEVGGWDSVIDIVLAARLIEELGPTDWQCGAIPIGGLTAALVDCLNTAIPCGLKAPVRSQPPVDGASIDTS